MRGNKGTSHPEKASCAEITGHECFFHSPSRANSNSASANAQGISRCQKKDTSNVIALTIDDFSQIVDFISIWVLHQPGLVQFPELQRIKFWEGICTSKHQCTNDNVPRCRAGQACTLSMRVRNGPNHTLTVHCRYYSRSVVV